MATDEIIPKYTWGDSVLIAAKAEAKFRPRAYGAICGLTKPEKSEAQYRYTVEYNDGSSQLIPEDQLEPYPES